MRGGWVVKSLQAPPGFAQFCWLNGPFYSDGLEEGGGRLEPKFFRRVVEEGKWVQPGGIVERARTVSSIAALPDDRREIVLDEFRALAADHPDLRGHAEITLPYTTKVYWTERLG